MGDIGVRIVASDDAFAGALTAYLAAEPAVAVLEGPGADVAVVFESDPLSPLSALEAVVGEHATLVIGPDDPQAMIRVFELGADGYLPEGCAFDEIRDAVSAVAEGRAVVPPHMLGSLLHYVVRRKRATRVDLERLDTLTKRERQVFDLLAIGLDRAVIAERLYVSVGTVRTHLQRVFKKLDAHTHVEVIALAARCGLIPRDREETP